MSRFILCLVLTTPLLFSCAATKPYAPVNKYEEAEYPKAAADVYPDSVRSNLDQYTNTLVAWVGVIRNTDAQEDGENGMIRAVSTLDHHYYDWELNRNRRHLAYMISPRGEGPFRIEWKLRRKTQDATASDAEQFAAPGKVAVVYGIPESVDEDGVIVLKYHYLRLLDDKAVDMQTYDYGRIGEPYRYRK